MGDFVEVYEWASIFQSVNIQARILKNPTGRELVVENWGPGADDFGLGEQNKDIISNKAMSFINFCNPNVNS